ncbi:unnamed protein product [Victoria cruziana]
MVLTSSQLCVDSSEWPQIQERGLMPSPSSSSSSRAMEQAAGIKNPADAALKCPRCDSSNTKFCYYNNYSLSQPRHFCKTCKRYWTRGGTLRNVPVGGGCRKNKRVKRTATIDHGGPSSHLKNPTLVASNATSSSQPTLPPTPPLTSLATSTSATATTTSSALQNSSFLNHEFHINNSLVSSLKSVLSSGAGFPAKENTLECNFLQDQNGFSGISPIPGASSLFPTTFSHLGQPFDGLSGNMSSGILAEAPWRHVQQQNFFLPLEEFSNGGNQPKVSEENMRNLSVKIEEDGKRMGQLEWQVSNQAMFGTNNNEPSLYWNQSVGSWPDVTNYGSSIASLM